MEIFFLFHNCFLLYAIKLTLEKIAHYFSFYLILVLELFAPQFPVPEIKSKHDPSGCGHRDTTEKHLFYFSAVIKFFLV